MNIQFTRKSIYMFMAIFVILASGCAKQTTTPISSAATPAEIAVTDTSIPTVNIPPTVTFTPLPTPTQTQKPTATILPTDTQTPTPEASPTPKSSPTTEASPTPSITASPTYAFNLPGYYATGGCQTYMAYWQLYVDFCVESVEVKKDGRMVYVVSWTIHIPEEKTVTKHSDAGNHAMYIMDNLGNKYDFLEVGGTAAQELEMKNGDTAIGIFIFPHANPGATSFTFYDKQQKVAIGGIVLVNPIVVYELMELKWYPFTLEYRVAVWKPEVSEEGGGLITHTKIAGCKIQEWQPSQPQGKLKNTIEVGKITYQIYGFTEAGKNYSVREYLAIKGVEGIDPNSPPFFRVTIPWDQAEQCILDASEALAGLAVKE
jgi:hypothetical protein